MDVAEGKPLSPISAVMQSVSPLGYRQPVTLMLWQPLAEAIGSKDQTHSAEVDAVLAEHEQGGWELSVAVKLLMGGERDILVLTDDVDANSGAIIEHILHQVSGRRFPPHSSFSCNIESY